MSFYLVTGGAGFIGSHLVEKLLAEGHRVRVLDDLSTGKVANLTGGVELIVGDVANATIVDKAIEGVDGVFHLAAVASVERSTNDWLRSHRTNVSGTATILDCVGRMYGDNAPPVVYASSAAVYGSSTECPISEDDETCPITPYGVDKLGSELHARAAAIHYGVPTVGFRFFNVYGPRQDPSSPYSGVISIFTRLLLTGEFLTINGDGQQTRDFIYVGDIVRHLIAGMDMASVTPRVFNACTGKGISVKELADVIADSIGCQPHIAYGANRKGDIRHSVGNPMAAKTILGVAAEVSLEKGLAETVAYLFAAEKECVA